MGVVLEQIMGGLIDSGTWQLASSLKVNVNAQNRNINLEMVK